jgi:hypothetical protein
LQRSSVGQILPHHKALHVPPATHGVTLLLLPQSQSCVCCNFTAFNQLKTPVEKSDAWRYHVLCGHGGIYTDTDTVCARPFSEWTNFNSTPEPGLIVGIENRFYTQEVR